MQLERVREFYKKRDPRMGVRKSMIMMLGRMERGNGERRAKFIRSVRSSLPPPDGALETERRREQSACDLERERPAFGCERLSESDQRQLKQQGSGMKFVTRILWRNIII